MRWAFEWCVTERAVQTQCAAPVDVLTSAPPRGLTERRLSAYRHGSDLLWHGGATVSGEAVTGQKHEVLSITLRNRVTPTPSGPSTTHVCTTLNCQAGRGNI